MIVHRAFKFRIYPTPEQAARMDRWSDALRFLWNLAHEQRLMDLARPRGERRCLSAHDQGRELTGLRADLPWLADVPRDVSKHLLGKLDDAWLGCFRKLNKRPRWKRKSEALGLCAPGPDRWHLNGNVLHFPKIGPLRIVVHRPVVGKHRTCTIKRDGDQWFASLAYLDEVAAPTPRVEPVVAIDRGVLNIVADSDGRIVESPRFLHQALRRLARAQRTVSRRKKGSKNQAKAKLRVMRLHRTVRRQREHFLHVLSHGYAKSHGTVVIEKLQIENMVKTSRGLARGIYDAGWGSFAQKLGYKLDQNGGTLVKVPAHYSSQTCSVCGVVDDASRVVQAVFDCTSCGHHEHADVNAAKILKSRANRPAQPVEGSLKQGALRSRKRTARATRSGLPIRTSRSATRMETFS